MAMKDIASSAATPSGHPWKSLYLPLGLFAIAHTFIFRFLLAIGNQVLFEQASAVFNGQLPYRDFLLEYPPLALAVLLPPRLAGPDTWAYGRAFSYEMLLVDVAILLLLALISGRLRLPAWQPLAVYTAALVAAGSLASQRYDLWPALLVLAALFWFSRGNYTLCWLFLALGFTAKLYPALLAPPLAIYQITRRDCRGLAKGLGLAALAVVLIIVPWLIVSPGGFWESLQYQFGRGLQMESTYASALEVAATLGLTHLTVVFQSGADNVTSPLASTLARLSSFASVLAMVGVWFAYATTRLKARQAQDASGTPQVVDLCTMTLFWALGILAFLLTSKVLSPQFLVWLMPIVALVAVRQRWWVWAMFVAAAALSYYVFPDRYYDLMDFKGTAVAALVLRNLLLLAIALLLLRWGLKHSTA